ncbi:PRC-barrel domain-containing protein [Pseudooceanicola algae]|uniref:PRC-barrel domain-containing protein n=1 Tax=Pseudooceanicola algae TaxID=1537215 RepID=A0A418SKY1_9RHOB|nr:PRC-barrel domain-containing protein [Pseudooceanicola algae]QPM90993.1 hypothetical protein PSAL_022360 [Pseudooceanicola algae]
MTKFFATTSRAALIALIAAAPMSAFAQDAEPAQSDMMEAPADDSVDMPMEDGGAEMNAETDSAVIDDPAAPAASDDIMADEATDEAPAKPVEGQITLQDENTILAADLIGATVYSQADEVVGDIDDLIIGLDGTVHGVIIGVGGFLGMGEKHVAVEMAALEVMTDDSGNPRLFTSATKEDLEAAQEFVSAEEQEEAADNAAMQSEAGSATGTGTMNAAPVE